MLLCKLLKLILHIIVDCGSLVTFSSFCRKIYLIIASDTFYISPVFIFLFINSHLPASIYPFAHYRKQRESHKYIGSLWNYNFGAFIRKEKRPVFLRFGEDSKLKARVLKVWWCFKIQQPKNMFFCLGTETLVYNSSTYYSNWNCIHRGCRITIKLMMIISFARIWNNHEFC